MVGLSVPVRPFPTSRESRGVLPAPGMTPMPTAPGSRVNERALDALDPLAHPRGLVSRHRGRARLRAGEADR
jgi:hypothetical protein